MARQKASVEYSDFTQGFITEASPLTFPENASVDEMNVNINKDGSRQRRFGMDWTDAATSWTPASVTAPYRYAVSTYSWFSAGNDGDENLGVIQEGSILRFYDLGAADPSSAAALVDTVDLNSSAVGMDRYYPFSYASAYGKLFIATNSTNVVILSWDGSSITVQKFTLAVRDRWGVEDGYDVDEHGTTATLDSEHRYNLANQGWPKWMTCASDAGGSTVSVGANPIDYTRLATSMGFWPSNADLVWASKLGAVTGVQTDNIDAYSPWELQKNLFGTTPAPKGRVILNNIFSRGYWRTFNADTGYVLTLPTDQTSGSVTSVSAFAGRLWYTLSDEGVTAGDDNTPELGNLILYSQAADDFTRWNACHTRNDPTAEDYNDVLASDGGYVAIPEAGYVYCTVPLGESIFVFATNGVWEIFGGDTTFSAKQQSVLKVTKDGPISRTSIVNAENTIGYWSETGIFAISIDPQSMRGIANNITEERIQSFYDDIPEARKKEAVGNYDSIGKQVSWLYRSTGDLVQSRNSPHFFDKEIILDTVKAAFTKRDINQVPQTSAEGPWVIGALDTRKLVQGTTDEVVTNGGVDVTNGGVDVTISVTDAEQKSKTSLRYFSTRYISTTEYVTMTAYTDVDFVDWPNVTNSEGGTGVDAAAYLLTGYLTGGDSSRVKNAPYITVKSKRTESDWSIDGSGVVTMVGESSCTMQAQWDWTNDPLSGKWSTEQEVYKLPRFVALSPEHVLSYDVINTRNKVKGSGNALSLKFSSSPGKDMYLLGWGIDIVQDTQPSVK